MIEIKTVIKRGKVYYIPCRKFMFFTIPIRFKSDDIKQVAKYLSENGY